MTHRIHHVSVAVANFFIITYLLQMCAAAHSQTSQQKQWTIPTYAQ